MPEDESSSDSCLHCEINEVVREHIDGQKTVNIAELVAKMGESLVELILFAPEDQHANLLATTIAHMGHVFLEKSEEIEGRADTTH